MLYVCERIALFGFYVTAAVRSLSLLRCPQGRRRQGIMSCLRPSGL